MIIYYSMNRGRSRARRRRRKDFGNGALLDYLNNNENSEAIMTVKNRADQLIAAINDGNRYEYARAYRIIENNTNLALVTRNVETANVFNNRLVSNDEKAVMYLIAKDVVPRGIRGVKRANPLNAFVGTRFENLINPIWPFYDRDIAERLQQNADALNVAEEQVNNVLAVDGTTGERIQAALESMKNVLYSVVGYLNPSFFEYVLLQNYEQKSKGAIITMNEVNDLSYVGRMAVIIKKGVVVRFRRNNRQETKTLKIGTTVYQQLTTTVRDEVKVVTIYFYNDDTNNINIANNNITRNKFINGVNVFSTEVREDQISKFPDDSNPNSFSNYILREKLGFTWKCENYSLESKGAVVGRVPPAALVGPYTALIGVAFSYLYTTVSAANDLMVIFLTPTGGASSDLWDAAVIRRFPECEHITREVENTLASALRVTVKAGGKFIKFQTGTKDMCDAINDRSLISFMKYLFTLNGIAWVVNNVGKVVGATVGGGGAIYILYRYFFISVWTTLGLPTLGSVKKWLKKQWKKYFVNLDSTWSEGFLLKWMGKSMLALVSLFQPLATGSIESIISVLDSFGLNQLLILVDHLIWLQFLLFLHNNMCPILLYFSGQLEKCGYYNPKRNEKDKQKKNQLHREMLNTLTLKF